MNNPSKLLPRLIPTETRRAFEKATSAIFTLEATFPMGNPIRNRLYKARCEVANSFMEIKTVYNWSSYDIHMEEGATSLTDTNDSVV